MRKIYFVSSGTPTPTQSRFGTCYVLQLGDEFLMFDCGPAATHKLVKIGLFPTQIGYLFLATIISIITLTIHVSYCVVGTKVLAKKTLYKYGGLLQQNGLRSISSDQRALSIMIGERGLAIREAKRFLLIAVARYPDWSLRLLLVISIQEKLSNEITGR